MENLLQFQPNSNGKEQFLKTIKSLKFAPYSHKFITEDKRIIEKWFIVLKDRETDVTLEFTPFTRLLRYSDVKMDLRRSETIRAWAKDVCVFLNYVFIDEYEKFKIDSLTDITIDIGNKFMQDYADGKVGGDKDKKLETVDHMMSKLSRLYSHIKSIYKKDARHIYSYEWKYKTSEGFTRYNCPFKIDAEKNKHISEIRKPIFRDMPIEIFEIFLNLSKEKYPELTFAIALEAFAGLRPGEVCNVRQAIDPSGAGIRYEKKGSKIVNIEIDLTDKYQMRSDGKDVGGIKVRRKQRVYTPYTARIEGLYKEHLIELKRYNLEPGFYPMFVNRDGKALTYKSYRDKIKRLTNHLKKMLAKSDNPGHRHYAQKIVQNKGLAPHFLRHYFTVLLVLDNLAPHEIATWRGDKSLDSALSYTKNKTELISMIKRANTRIIDTARKGGVADNGSS